MLATRIRLCLLLGALAAVSGQSHAAYQPETPDKDGVERFVPPAIPFVTPVDERVLTLAFSPDGKKLVTAGARYTQPGQLKIWDVATAQELLAVRGFAGVRSIAWSPDAQTLATGDFSGTIRMRDATTGAERAAATGHKIGINAIAFSFDGALLVSAGLDRVVKLWDAADLKEKKEFTGHGDMVYAAAFFRHGQAFVTGGKDGTAKIWDIVFLHEHPFGDAEIRRICIAGTTGGPKTSLDVRITDFRIRADAIPKLPATPAHVVPAAAVPAPPAASGSSGWWVAGLSAVFAVTVFVAMALGVVLYLRQRGLDKPVVAASAKSKPTKPKPATSITAAPALVFACADCGKKLKVKANLAGKKIKCAGCGKPTFVPAVP